MKITAFNINGLKTSIKYINKLLLSPVRPDILGLNEIKCSPNTLEKLKPEISLDILKDYNIIWNPATISWHGTAMFILKKYDYKLLYTSLPPTKKDDETIKAHTEEGRIIVVDINGVCFVLTYVPNSGVNIKEPLRRLDYRVNSWDVDMFKLLNLLYEKYNGRVIWFGDMNVARTVLDIKRPGRKAGYTEEERKSFNTFLESGKFIDIWRELHPGIQFTFKTGWRLDYFIISDKIYTEYTDIKCEIDEDPENISDHFPLTLNVKL